MDKIIVLIIFLFTCCDISLLGLLFVTENRQFRQFIILTMMVPLQHDAAIVYRNF